MKKLLLLLGIVCSLPTFGQNVLFLNLTFGELVIYQTTRTRVPAIPGNYYYTDREKINILEKQYLTEHYVPSHVDGHEDESYLRFNHYNDQMEFVMGNTIHYLKKETGRTVLFKDQDLLYRVYELYGDLDYLLVKVEGENSLLVKQSSKFIPPMRTQTSYGFQINPTFRRNSDQFFLSTPQGEMIKLSWKKKKFISAFGEKATHVEEYMAENKLNHKRADDVAQVVEFYNSL